MQKGFARGFGECLEEACRVENRSPLSLFLSLSFFLLLLIHLGYVPILHGGIVKVNLIKLICAQILYEGDPRRAQTACREPSSGSDSGFPSKHSIQRPPGNCAANSSGRANTRENKADQKRKKRFLLRKSTIAGTKFANSID